MVKPRATQVLILYTLVESPGKKVFNDSALESIIKPDLLISRPKRLSLSLFLFKHSFCVSYQAEFSVFTFAKESKRIENTSIVSERSIIQQTVHYQAVVT